MHDNRVILNITNNNRKVSKDDHYLEYKHKHEQKQTQIEKLFIFQFLIQKSNAFDDVLWIEYLSIAYFYTMIKIY